MASALHQSRAHARATARCWDEEPRWAWARQGCDPRRWGLGTGLAEPGRWRERRSVGRVPPLESGRGRPARKEGELRIAVGDVFVPRAA